MNENKKWANLPEWIIMLFELCVNKKFISILLISYFLSNLVIKDALIVSGVNLIPVTIGVIFGGLLTTTAIIFGLMKEDELELLYLNHGDKVFNSIKRIKFHLIVLVLILLLNVLSFVITIPEIIKSLFTSPSLFFTIFATFQLFCLILTVFIGIGDCR